MTDVVYFQAVDKVGLTRLYRLGLIHYFYVLNIYKFVTINMFNCYDTIAYKKIVSATKLETLSQFVNICSRLFLRVIHVNYVGTHNNLFLLLLHLRTNKESRSERRNNSDKILHPLH